MPTVLCDFQFNLQAVGLLYAGIWFARMLGTLAAHRLQTVSWFSGVQGLALPLVWFAACGGLLWGSLSWGITVLVHSLVRCCLGQCILMRCLVLAVYTPADTRAERINSFLYRPIA